MPSSVQAHSSHTKLTGTTATAARTSERHRVTAISWTTRVLLLVDALIDRAHLKSPTESGVLLLPTGESVFIPRHRTEDPACHPDHTGYFQARVRPNCATNPIPRQRGTSGLRPLILDLYRYHIANGAPVARYTLDLRTGDLFIVCNDHPHQGSDGYDEHGTANLHRLDDVRARWRRGS